MSQNFSKFNGENKRLFVTSRKAGHASNVIRHFSLHADLAIVNYNITEWMPWFGMPHWF